MFIIIIHPTQGYLEIAGVRNTYRICCPRIGDVDLVLCGFEDTYDTFNQLV